MLEISKDAALVYIFAELNISNKETVRHLNISPAAFRELKTNIGSPKENQSKKVDTERWDYLIPLTHQDPVFISTFHEFVAMRKEIKKPIISEIGVKKLMNTLSGYTVEEGIEALNTSIAGGYQGVFPKKKFGAQPQKNESNFDVWNKENSRWRKQKE